MDHVRLWRMQQEFRWLLISLLAQFLLGMVANLWVVIPARHPGTHAANYFLGLLQGIPWALASSNLFLRLHIAVGVMLWVLATLLLIEAIRWHDRRFLTVSITGWVGITGAGFNGGSFLNYGHDVSSFLMAVGFALAAACYVWGWAHSFRVASSPGQVLSYG